MIPSHYTVILSGILNIGCFISQALLLVQYGDLAAELTNSVKMCQYCNSILIPEMVTQVLITVILLLGGHWWLSFLNVPFTLYNYYFRFKKNELQIHPTDIFKKVSKYKIESFVKALFSFVMFFAYTLLGLLYWIESGPIRD